MSVTFNNGNVEKLSDLNPESVAHKTNALDHWAMMIYKHDNRYL